MRYILKPIIVHLQVSEGEKKENTIKQLSTLNLKPCISASLKCAIFNTIIIKKSKERLRVTKSNTIFQYDLITLKGFIRLLAQQTALSFN